MEEEAVRRKGQLGKGRSSVVGQHSEVTLSHESCKEKKEKISKRQRCCGVGKD